MVRRWESAERRRLRCSCRKQSCKGRERNWGWEGRNWEAFDADHRVGNRVVVVVVGRKGLIQRGN